MASNTASKKQKGRLLQKYVVEKIREIFSELTERDVSSRSMGSQGEDIVLSEKGFEVFPYAVECKNQERLQLWEALEQAESRKDKGTPLLIFKRNRSKVYCVLELDNFLKLVKK